MGKQEKALGAVAFLLLVALIAGLLPLYPMSRISEANCNRISPGTTEQKVEDILGGPATSKTLVVVEYDGNLSKAIGKMPLDYECKVWTEGNKEIKVLFANGKVKWARFQKYEPTGDFDICNPSNWFDVARTVPSSGSA